MTQALLTAASAPAAAPPEVPAPSPPSPTELVVQPPPALERTETGGALVSALGMLGSVGSIALMTTMGGHGGARAYLAGGLGLLATIGFVVAQVERQRRTRRRRTDEQRGDYLRYLASVRQQVRAAAGAQRRALLWHHPAPAALAALAAEGSRVAERGPGDERFLQVSYGLGTRPAALRPVLAEDPVPGGRPDPVAVSAARRLVEVHREQPGLPLTIDLRRCRHLELAGDPEAVRAAARAVLCSATVFHAPEHLAVAVLTTPALRAPWEWLKWLPHALSTRRCDAVGPRRMVATTPTELATLLPRDPDRPESHVLLVLDGVPLPRSVPLRAGLTVIDLAGSSRVDPAPPSHVRLDADEAGLDRLDPASAEACARRLAHRRSVTTIDGRGDPAGRPRDLLGLVGLDPDSAVAPATRPRTGADRLRVPIGVDDTGEPVHLDLKESAEQGMGPHGLVIGATGSGKSELLRTLVLALALTHPPEQLNLVLVDFKGGATFAGTAGLPHVSALITNLADDLALVMRMQDALAGELVRRQELLRAAGNLASLAEYEQERRRRPSLAPLPALLVVVDEFSELLAAQPELTDLFVAIGRLGRSLGVHLLLASQRLDEGRLRGLESHLSYRIALRTFSAHESRAVLGTREAYELPTVPGLGYLRSGPDAAVRFQATYVSGPPPAVPGQRAEHAPADAEILPFTTAPVARHDARTVVREAPPATGSLLELVVSRLAGTGTPARRIWLPPLDRPVTLDALLSGPTRAEAGVVALGIVDRPREQRHEPLLVDLRGAGGHVAIVGGPRSGRSTLLATFVASLALTSTPVETQVFVLDLGGALGTLAGLPHVSGIATRTEPEVVRRVVAEVRGLLEGREARACDRYGEVFLVVDGWAALRADFEELEAELQQVAERGLAHGVHLVTATTRWADYRPALRDLLGTRLELRLGDPVDSVVDRRAAALIPSGRPGRGLTADGMHFLAALPRIDGERDAATSATGLARLVDQARRSWTGPPAPRLRLLPERVALDEVRATGEDSAGRLLLGLTERDLTPLAVDPDAAPHLLVFGDGGSGRSALLRAYAQEVVRTRTPERAQLVVVDYRRSLLGEIPDAHLLHHLTSAAQATPALEDLAAYLRGRLPGPEVTPAQLRARSWWRGAEVFVLVDDYDLVATPHGSPLHPLVPLLAQARDVGLHLVLARRAGGASRALYEPVIQALCDLACPGLLLSGDPGEGPLLGSTRPVPAAPGRARLVIRGRPAEVVQLALAEIASPDSLVFRST